MLSVLWNCIGIVKRHTELDTVACIYVDSTAATVTGIARTDAEFRTQQCTYSFFTPTYCISFAVLINTGYLESRNIKLVNKMCYIEFKYQVSEQ